MDILQYIYIFCSSEHRNSYRFCSTWV